MAASGGIYNSVINARKIGAKSFAVFLKSPRRWVSKDYTQEEIDKFGILCEKHGYNPRTDILPHGQYFINLANPESEKEEKSYKSFVDDLKRCEQLGIGLYNFHPGSSLDSDHGEALKRLGKNINRGIKETKFVKIVIENMAGHGNLIGSKLEDIGKVIEMVEDKERIGVCIDTCHTYSAGYDIEDESKFGEFLKKFEEVIGMNYLSSVHLNDSKAPFNSNRDLHQKLGHGYLGLEIFRVICNLEKFEGIPIILETPIEKGEDDLRYGEEIELLNWLIGKKKEDEEYVKKKEELSLKGKKEREEQMKKYLVRQEKEEKKRKKEEGGNTKKRGIRENGEDILSQLSKKKKTTTTRKEKEEKKED
ncbi:DNA-(apurinic or apyrimidinic site) lyase APN1 [Ascoidea rubescens DSM 1968]|uniref:Apurinic-apyrimidinic endonuclease 1 n=1 Tax=Ascoidea rubescens DSM 1968 TaxID=1344418 RepID=A0A1D2VJL9_9ASCO|nr:AP endonuclease [Ascoidea rubescens DSM 1968]ODV61783.1 AP endonuclease [Ascoidea rubescens DSM 1968]